MEDNEAMLIGSSELLKRVSAARVARHSKGMTLRKVAAAAGCSHTTVARALGSEGPISAAVLQFEAIMVAIERS